MVPPIPTVSVRDAAAQSKRLAFSRDAG